MRKMLMGAAAAAVLGLAGCTPAGTNALGGALVGGSLGLITADILSNDPEWLLVGALAGATAGSLVASNQRAGVCAYARGDGTYYRAACPRRAVRVVGPRGVVRVVRPGGRVVIVR